MRRCIKGLTPPAVYSKRGAGWIIHTFSNGRAMLGGVLGYAWSWIWPGIPPGLLAVLGAGAVLAATTQGPISTGVLLMELTGRDRSFILPLLLVIGTATIVSRMIEPRSIYDARLTDKEVAARQRMRERQQGPAMAA